MGDDSGPSSIPGTYPCGKCDYCPFILRSGNVSLPNDAMWTPRYRVTCQSIRAVYIMKCCCGAFYVRKTKRPFYHGIRDHVSLISSRHVGLHHNFDPTSIKFFALEHIPAHEWGGDIDKKLLQLESKCIYLLQATRYPGLNERIRYKPFIWFFITQLEPSFSGL